MYHLESLFKFTHLLNLTMGIFFLQATLATATIALISTSVRTPFWPELAWKTPNVATFRRTSSASARKASKETVKRSAEVRDISKHVVPRNAGFDRPSGDEFYSFEKGGYLFCFILSLMAHTQCFNVFLCFSALFEVSIFFQPRKHGKITWIFGFFATNSPFCGLIKSNYLRRRTYLLVNFR